MGLRQSSTAGRSCEKRIRQLGRGLRGSRLWPIAWTAMSVLFFCPPDLAVQPQGQGVQAVQPEQARYAADEVLVLVSADANGNGLVESNESLDGVDKIIPGQIARRTPVGRGKQAWLVKLPPGKGARAAINERWNKKDKRILAVDPNYEVKALLTPNDPRYPELWGLHNTGQTGGVNDADIDAPEAWNTSVGSSSVVVAVIDTGVDYMHPELSGNMWHNPGESGGGKETNGIDDDGNGYIDDVYGWDCYQEDNTPDDPNSHGTHVSGTIAARGNNGIGVAGVNWNCSIMSVRFLDASGSGWLSDAIEAINYAVANGAKILNNSWGGGGYNASLAAAIANAQDHGVLFVAAAGNSGSDNDVSPMYPASYTMDNVLAVAATDHSDALAYFSCYGLTSVDVGAPGLNIASTIPGVAGDYSNAYGTKSGTSMATPHVCGVAALLLAANPSMSVSDLKQRIMSTGNSIPALAGKTVSGRRINAALALGAVPKLELTSPNGGEMWTTGTTRTISWESFSGGATVNINLYKGGVYWANIATAAPNNGAFAWAIPSLPAGSNYRVRITDGVRTDDSDADFSIVLISPVYTNTFESGLGGFVIDNAYGTGGGLWHLSTGRSVDSGHTASHSVYYGTGEGSTGGGNYAVGSTAGAIVSPQISLANVAAPCMVQFSYFLQTEVLSGYDIARVSVSKNGGEYTLLAGNQGGVALSDPSSTWKTCMIDLSAYAGSVIQLRFTFDTVDSLYNSFEGWYIDDVTVSGLIAAPIHNITRGTYHATIQGAIDAALAADEIVMAPGTYTGSGNRDVDFKGKAIILRSSDPENPAVVAATIVDCQGTSSDRHRGFKFVTNEGNGSVLNGVTITHGYAPLESGTGMGGAILCSSGAPTIMNCVIKQNTGQWGGGLSCLGDVSGQRLSLRFCTFAQNTSTDIGGAIHVLNGQPRISNCRFYGNTATGGGGGVFLDSGTGTHAPEVTNCIFDANQAGGYGGAIRNKATALVSGCTLVHNSASDGGGIYSSSTVVPRIFNCIVWANSDGGGTDESAQINPNGAAADIDYTCIQGCTGLLAGVGNFGADPLLMDADGADNNAATWVDNDLHLQGGSPCVNAGDPAGGYTGQKDMDGEERVRESRADVGADESPYWRDCDTSSPVWWNSPMEPKSGIFNAEYDAIPNGANIDALTGLSSGAGTGFSSFAVMLRFNTSGSIDARNGGAYAAVTSVPYTAGVSYHFRLVVNVPSKQYSAYVTPAGGAEATIASNYAFRTEQNGVTQLNNLGIFADIGSHQVCGFHLGSMFTNINAAIAQVGNASADWGDYDNDGDLDLVLMGFLWQWSPAFPPVTKIYRNDGGVFTDINASLTAVDGGSCKWGDYDNDGDLDLAVSGWGSQQITRIYTNNGGTFTPTSQSFPISGRLDWGDYDNDGDLDWVISGTSSGSQSVTAIYRNDGGGTFTDALAGLPAIGGRVVWGDYDSDSDLDLVISGENVSRIYRNNGNGSFTDINAGLPGAYTPGLAWGDYNSDGQLDLVFTSTATSAIYRNNGGVFTNISAGLPNIGSSYVSWGDHDNDGDLDLLMAGSVSSFVAISTVYRNEGAGVFVDIDPGLTQPTPLMIGVCTWGDYDNDGDLDLILAGETPDTEGAASRIYRNDGQLFNTPPAAPTGLTAAFAGGNAVFSWSAASDAQTPVAGLTYNLRVGTTPGGDQILSGMSAATGWRRVATMGNVQKNLSWTLKGLPVQTYYWSVQAVDTALAGGPWAAEQVFELRVQNVTQSKWYSTIQAAINAANAGDDIVLNQGTYTGSGNRDVDLLGKAVTVRSGNPNDPAVVAATIIDCQGAANDAHRGFVMKSGEGSGTVISGLTIKNGYAPLENGRSIGGGICCASVYPTITNCVLANNTSGFWGGGLAITGGGPGGQSATVRRCVFSGNESLDVGGGLYVLNSAPVIANCRFYSNRADGGGGLFLQSFTPTQHPQVLNCVFDANHAEIRGGAVRSNEYASPVISNCTLVNNNAPDVGGIHISASAYATVVNCVLWGNVDDGGADESAQISVGAGSLALQYSCIQGLSAFAGNWNIGVDPALVDIDGLDNDPSTWQDNNLHLKSNSPCLNAGDPNSSYSGQKDTDGGPRVQGGVVEIGADEWYPGDFDWNGKVNQADLDHFMDCAWGPAIAPADPACADANLDRDPAGDVDAVDFAIFQRCWTGEAGLAVGCGD